eukprot:COSAG06_NODE_59669_length_273_cov_0.890805_1_plen_49_part_10
MIADVVAESFDILPRHSYHYLPPYTTPEPAPGRVADLAAETATVRLRDH